MVSIDQIVEVKRSRQSSSLPHPPRLVIIPHVTTVLGKFSTENLVAGPTTSH